MQQIRISLPAQQTAEGIVADARTDLRLSRITFAEKGLVALTNFYSSFVMNYEELQVLINELTSRVCMYYCVGALVSHDAIAD